MPTRPPGLGGGTLFPQFCRVKSFVPGFDRPSASASPSFHTTSRRPPCPQGSSGAHPGTLNHYTRRSCVVQSVGVWAEGTGMTSAEGRRVGPGEGGPGTRGPGETRGRRRSADPGSTTHDRSRRGGADRWTRRDAGSTTGDSGFTRPFTPPGGRRGTPTDNPLRRRRGNRPRTPSGTRGWPSLTPSTAPVRHGSVSYRGKTKGGWRKRPVG